MELKWGGNGSPSVERGEVMRHRRKHFLGERMRGGKAAWEQQNLWQFCFGRRVEELGAEQERGQG